MKNKNKYRRPAKPLHRPTKTHKNPKAYKRQKGWEKWEELD